MARTDASQSGNWTFWQNPDLEMFGEASYSWSFLLKIDLPILIGMLLLLALPPVQAWTGCDLRIVGAGFAIHFGYAMIVNFVGFKRVNPRGREFVSHLVNVIAVVSIPLSTTKPLFALWALYPLIVWMDGYGSPKSVASLLTSMILPWADPLWHLDTAVAQEKAVLAGLSMVTGIVVYLVASYFTGWSRANLRKRSESDQEKATIAERERIGRSLHGTLGAALSEITLWHEVALAGNGRDADSSDDPLTRAQARARSALTELRALVAGMDEEPATADGLFKSVRERAGGLCAAAGVSFALEGEAGEGGSPDAPVSQATAYHVAKIVIEGVTNAVRHARPASIRVSLSLSPLSLEVADDGRGFDPGNAPPGRGLRSLREHAEALGASLEMISSSGKGTRIVVRGKTA